MPNPKRKPLERKPQDIRYSRLIADLLRDIDRFQASITRSIRRYLASGYISKTMKKKDKTHG